MGDNGMNGSMKLITWVGGVVGLLITIYVTFHQPLANAIAKESEIRQACDMEISKEQTKVNQEILICLSELKSDIKYIKVEVKK